MEEAYSSRQEEILAEVEIIARDLINIVKEGTQDILRYGPISTWDEFELLPTEGRLTRAVPALSLEIAGLMKAGKTALCEELAAKEYNLDVKTEFLTPEIKSLRDLMIATYKYWDVLWRAKYAGEDAVWGAEYGWLPRDVIIERGFHDLLGFNAFLPDTELSEDERLQLFLLRSAGLIGAKTVDAVVLMGVDKDVAKARGTKKEHLWTRLSYGYTLWLRTIYPYYRDKFGTGILVLNGGRSVEYNLRKVRTYYWKCVALRNKVNPQIQDFIKWSEDDLGIMPDIGI